MALPAVLASSSGTRALFFLYALYFRIFFFQWEYQPELHVSAGCSAPEVQPQLLASACGAGARSVSPAANIKLSISRFNIGFVLRTGSRYNRLHL